jgi:hypothetical protein
MATNAAGRRRAISLPITHFKFIGNCFYVHLSILQSNVDGLDQTVEEAPGFVSALTMAPFPDNVLLLTIWPALAFWWQDNGDF